MYIADFYITSQVFASVATIYRHYQHQDSSILMGPFRPSSGVFTDTWIAYFGAICSEYHIEYTYAFVDFFIKLERRPIFYVMTLLIPCIVLSLLTVVVFLVPPEAGEKISLSISVLLSFIMFLMILADNIPRTSNRMPILGKNLNLIVTIQAYILSVIARSCYVIWCYDDVVSGFNEQGR